MKVMNFLRFRNMTNEKEESTKYTIKTLFKLCALRFRASVLTTWYFNYLKPYKKIKDRLNQRKDSNPIEKLLGGKNIHKLYNNMV